MTRLVQFVIVFRITFLATQFLNSLAELCISDLSTLDSIVLRALQRLVSDSQIQYLWHCLVSHSLLNTKIPDHVLIFLDRVKFSVSAAHPGKSAASDDDTSNLPLGSGCMKTWPLRLSRSVN